MEQYRAAVSGSDVCKRLSHRLSNQLYVVGPAYAVSHYCVVE